MTDFHELPDLVSERLGGSVLYATDDFFAEKENLIKPAAPVWKEHEYTDRGKWMDGWESRRKRTPGHDFAILRLGARGVLHGIVVDTSFFRGNYPEACALDVCSMPPQSSVETLLAAPWIDILPQSPLKGDSQNSFDVDSRFAVTHLRFHIFPDGGVARLRVHGEVVPDWHREGGLLNELDRAGPPDLGGEGHDGAAEPAEEFLGAVEGEEEHKRDPAEDRVAGEEVPESADVVAARVDRNSVEQVREPDSPDERGAGRETIGSSSSWRQKPRFGASRSTPRISRETIPIPPPSTARAIRRSGSRFCRARRCSPIRVMSFAMN